MHKPRVTSVVELKKGKSYRRFVFYYFDNLEYASIQCNYDLNVYVVSVEYAEKEIYDLICKGYKQL